MLTIGWIMLGVTALAATENTFCPDGNYTSATVPTSVHKLKVGDIKVVAGMGDSGTAANGAESTQLFDIMTQYRGRSFSIGGASSYNYGLTTLPNILRLFNPHLRGYSTGVGDENSPTANLNVAQFGALSSQMKLQAELLIKRMKADPKINIDEDWKMVTLLTGGNDICRACANVSLYPASMFRANIEAALDVLQEGSPRTIVNLLEVFDITNLMKVMPLQPSCQEAMKIKLCPCPPGSDGSELSALSKEYQRALVNLINTGKYNRKPDFTVVIQPFLGNVPTTETGEPDMSFFTPDCFHLSTKGHSAAGVSLWNTMLRRKSKKHRAFNHPEQPMCPTTRYIPTQVNYS